MKFKYSICYPDKDEIQYFNRSVKGIEVKKLLESINWKKELAKPVEYYSIGLDVINEADRKRIILSGIGNSKLESFQVMFVNPIKDFNKSIFDENNYFNSISFSKEVSVDLGKWLLNQFLVSNYSGIKDRLNVDQNEDERNLVTFQSSEDNKKIIEQESENYELSKLAQFLIRLSAPILGLIFIIIGFKSSNELSDINGVSISFIIFGIFFILGTIVNEFKPNK